MRGCGPRLMVTALIAGSMMVGCAAPTGDDETGESTASAVSKSTDPSDPRWDCYAPEPNHPTDSEQSGFIARVGPVAQEAERTHGPPAAALLAMAALEGGFGFTRTAQYARNIFGYKYTSAAAAGGRDAYALLCQPSSDTGNRYIVFADERDAVLFVAQKLATRADWANYRAVTDAYRAARQRGVDVVTAVDAWVDGIADQGYNYDPPAYKARLKSLLKTTNLYRFSSTDKGGVE